MTIGLGAYTWAWNVNLLLGEIAQTAQLAVAVIGAVFTVALFLPIGRRPHVLAGTSGMKEGTQEQFNQKDTAFNVAHVGGYGPEAGKRRWALLKRDPSPVSFGE